MNFIGSHGKKDSSDNVTAVFFICIDLFEQSVIDYTLIACKMIRLLLVQQHLDFFRCKVTV